MNEKFNNSINTTIYDKNLAVQVQKQIQINNPLFVPALKRLLSEAEEAMSVGPWSVLDKVKNPEIKVPSGDMHDYMSLSTDAWPNPDTADGFPWIQLDGFRNPQCDDYDFPGLNELKNYLSVLVPAAYFS